MATSALGSMSPIATSLRRVQALVRRVRLVLSATSTRARATRSRHQDLLAPLRKLADEAPRPRRSRCA